MAGKNLLNSIQVQTPQSNSFDLTHDVKMSCQMGKLYPVLCMEAVPGDKFNLSCESLIRFAPLVSPVMHRMDVTMHYFFVPYRLLWDGWQQWIVGEHEDTPTLPAFPTIFVGTGLTPADDTKSLSNYLGVPEITTATALNALPYAAYQCIYNEYYRDQNLSPKINFKLLNGDNTALAGELKLLRRRAWEHDYFTAALPFAQKGDPVSLPIAEFQDVYVRYSDPAVTGSGVGVSMALGAGVPPGGFTTTNVIASDPSLASGGVSNSFLYADTSALNAAAATINDVRRAFRLQEWLEKNARGGSRYIENILMHFGVKSSDARLQRPEYITGTKSPVVISEVLNTTGTAEAPQGTQAGHAVSVTSGNYGSYYAEEHGFIMGLMSILPKTAYQQGIPKHFLKTDRLDYYWPSFAHLGEQEIQNRELYANSATPTGTFGYIPRYAEYKFMPSRVAGDFQDTLAFWHMGRIFETEPTLSQAFIESDPTTRIFAVEAPDEDQLYCHVLNKINASRRMPIFGTPAF